MRFVLLLELFAGNDDLVRIDNDNEISAVDVGGVGRLVFAAQHCRNLTCKSAHRHIGRVHNVPFPGDILLICHKSFHGNTSLICLELRAASLRFTPTKSNV